MNCVGVFDVLTFDNSQTNHLALMPQYQVPLIVIKVTQSELLGSPLTFASVSCGVYAASRPSVPGKGSAGTGVQFPGWHSEGEPAEGDGAGVSELLFRPQEPHSVSKRLQ